MTLTQEQISELKAQLKEQVQHLPEEKKSQALSQIDSLSPEALENMLKQQQSSDPTKKEKGVFRMIVDKDIKSVPIEEDDWALAVLDIAPISTGHVIIIPKTAAIEEKEIPKKAASMAKGISKRLIKKLKSKSTDIKSEFKFGEYILNILPVYDIPLTLASPRSKASTEELERLASLLKKKSKPKIEKIKIKTKESSQNQILKLSRRIP